MKKLWLFVFVFVLAACGGGPDGGPASEEPTADSSTNTTTEPAGETAETEPQLAPELSVYNWSDYIDESLLTQYEEEYGVHIIYDNFASNEDLLAKLQAGATGYDVIFPSDYMVTQMSELGLLAELDMSQIPNFANIGENFKNAPFDPGNKHCVPYQWGTTGLTYNPNHPSFAENPPDSWAYLFDPNLLQNYGEDGVNVLNDQRELMAAALFYLGHSPNTTDRAQLEEARDLILQAKPYWKSFNSEDYQDSLLVPGEVILSQAWSGDAALAASETYDEATGSSGWAYAIPQEGAVKWMDNICVTASSQRYETALHFINFLLDAENGAAITNFTYYASPNEAAKPHILPEILEDPGIYPPAEVEDKLDWLTDVGDAVFIYDEMWTAVKGSG